MTKFTFKIVRSFSVGFTVYAPSLNGFSVDIHFACFTAGFWNRGKRWISFKKYWALS